MKQFIIGYKRRQLNVPGAGGAYVKQIIGYYGWKLKVGIDDIRQVVQERRGPLYHLNVLGHGKKAREGMVQLI